MKIDIIATHPKAETRCELLSGQLQVLRLQSIAELARTPIAFSYRRSLLASQAELIHFHFPYPWAELSFLSSRIKKPYIVSYHCDIVKQKNLLKLWHPFMHRFLMGAAKVVVASPHIIKDSSIIRALPAEKITIIPYGIDTSIFIPTIDSMLSAKLLRTKLAGDKPLIFFLGRLVYYKGVNILIEAMKNLDAHLVIGGDGPLRNELEQITTEEGLTSKITFAGSISPEDLPLYYQAADMFILPSTDTSEAFGMVMLEAHASGIPVISTDLPTGVIFVNQHGETGYCVPTRNPIALSNAIQSLISNPILCNAMGRTAQKRACTEFDTKIMSSSYHMLYSKVIAQHNKTNKMITPIN